jgi:hypothetical protein
MVVFILQASRTPNVKKLLCVSPKSLSYNLLLDMMICVCVCWLFENGRQISKIYDKTSVASVPIMHNRTHPFSTWQRQCCHVGALLGEGDKHRLTWNLIHTNIEGKVAKIWWTNYMAPSWRFIWLILRPSNIRFGGLNSKPYLESFLLSVRGEFFNLMFWIVCSAHKLWM